MTVSRFKVGKMDCAAEEQLVRIALSDVAGVERISIDLGNQLLTVEHRTYLGVLDSKLQQLDLEASHIDDESEMIPGADPRTERHGLMFAFGVNAFFLVGELAFGLISGSIGLIADALDMGADASVYALSLAAVGTSTGRKIQLARRSGYLQLGLATIGLFEVVRRFITNSGPPEPKTMIIIALLALTGNVATLFVLQRIRTGEAHLQASWIFTANDIIVNGLVILAAILVVATDSATPDLIAGLTIFLVIANGARRILKLTN